MRRLLIVPVLAAALAVSACGTSSGTKKTVTVVNTITSSAATSAASGSAPPSGSGSAASSGASGITVVGSGSPSGSGSGAARSTPRTTVPATPTATASSAALVKVDPLQASCPALLASSDIKKAIGATVGTKNNRIRLGAAAHGVIGAIRCLYGSTDGGKSAPVRIRFTQYNAAAAAKKQVEVDVQAAQDGGATISPATVDGYPATLQLISGGVIEMQYDTWTMSLAVSDKLAGTAALTTGLPALAGQVLTRLIKNG